MIFNHVLEWAVQKGVILSSQHEIIQGELTKRLEAFAENQGSDVTGMCIPFSVFFTVFGCIPEKDSLMEKLLGLHHKISITLLSLSFNLFSH